MRYTAAAPQLLNLESARMDDAAFRAELARQGYGEPEVIERKPDHHNPEHTHDFAVSALILAGELSVTTAAGTTTCKAGDTFLLGAGIPHSEQYGPDGARVVYARRY